MKYLLFTLVFLFTASFLFAEENKEKIENQNLIEQVLAENVNDLSNWIKSATKTTGEFLSEQTPLYIEEYISWYFYSNLFYSIYGVVIFILTLITFLLFLKKGSKYDWNSEFHICMPLTVLLAIILVGTSINLICVVSNVQNCIKAYVAPRVLIVEQFGNLIR